LSPYLVDDHQKGEESLAEAQDGVSWLDLAGEPTMRFFTRPDASGLVQNDREGGGLMAKPAANRCSRSTPPLHMAASGP